MPGLHTPPAAAVGDAPITAAIPCAAPNEFARTTLRKILAGALGGFDTSSAGMLWSQLAAAVQAQDTTAFTAACKTLVNTLADAEAGDREGLFHAGLHLGLLSAGNLHGATIIPEYTMQGRAADLVIKFSAPEAVWIIEAGIGKSGATLAKKVAQGKTYGAPFTGDVLVCGLRVQSASKRARKGDNRPAVEMTVEWHRRDASKPHGWYELPAA